MYLDVVLHDPWRVRITIHGSEADPIKTRMHSSMMHTARSSSCLFSQTSGGCLPLVSARGVSAWGMSAQGVCVSQHALGQTPSPQTE